MSLFCKMLLYAFCMSFVICGAQAQTGQGILCDTEVQVRALAEAGGDTDALHVVNARTPNACAYVVVRYVDPSPIGMAQMGNQSAGIMQMTVTGFFMHGVWVDLTPALQFMLVPLGRGASLPLPTYVTWRPDGTQTPEQMLWFKNAQTTEDARLRLGWGSCCEYADRYVTTFEQDELTEKWYYLRDGKRVVIPADTIHHEDDPKMPAQLKFEGVLFLVNGVVACFWPPQTSG